MKKNLFAFVSFNRLSLSVGFAALLIALISQPLMAHAFSLPWSCDFEGGSLSSCGLSSENSNSTDFTSSSAAHNGTYGYRVTVNAGDNAGLGGFYGAIDSPATTTDVYVRWYMRYNAGFTWNPLFYQKLVYFNQMSNQPIYIQCSFSGANFQAETGTGQIYIPYGWGDIMKCPGGHSDTTCASDGQWHEYEIHVGLNNVFELWTDGVYRGKGTWSGSAPVGWSSDTSLSGIIQFNVNQAYPSGTGYVDWDDMAISTTGPIGPLTGGNPPSQGSNTLPAPPVLK